MDSASSLSRFDLLLLTIQSGADERSLRTLLKRYLDQAEPLLQKMEHALRSNNILAWHQAAKSLRALSLDIIARKLASVTGEALAINLLPHVQARSVLYHMQKEFALLKNEILSVLH